MWPSGNEFLQIRAGLCIISRVFSGFLVLSPPPTHSSWGGGSTQTSHLFAVGLLQHCHSFLKVRRLCQCSSKPFWSSLIYINRLNLNHLSMTTPGWLTCALPSHVHELSTHYTHCAKLEALLYSIVICGIAPLLLTSKEPVCPRVELILKIIIILLIIFLGFIKSKPC